MKKRPNASARAIRKAQTAFEGAAEAMGIVSVDDVQALIDEVRYGRSPQTFSLINTAPRSPASYPTYPPCP